MLEWPLTLSLGKALVPPAEFEPLLRKMVRLPWFRRGSMPGWLRSALVAIDPSLRKRVRSLLAARLGALGEQCAERRTATSAVQVAVEREYGRRVEEDEVWLSLLWGREPGGLALPASRLYRYLFHRGLVWMGPRPLALLAAAALLSAGIWLAMGYGIPVYRPPGPQIERIALDIALSQYYDPSYYAASAPSKSEAPADVPFPDWCYRVVQRVLARSITLVSPPATATPVPGMVSQGQGEAGIFAGSGQSLLFQKGRVAPKRSLSVSLEGKLSTGPFPPLPAAPSLPVQGQTIELANTPVRTGTPTPATAKLNVNVFDGARRPFANKVMYTVRDGNQKIFFEKIAGPNLSLQVPFYDNFADLYTVTASANGYQPAGFTPVTVRATNPVSLDLMLIPKNGTYHFVATSLSAIQTLRPGLGRLLEAGAASAADAQNRYSDLLEKQPAALADILNITAALEQIHLPSGTPEDYLQELVWDNTMKQDRFFVWADTRLADQISQAAARGVFAPEPGSGVFQAGATRVYKQIQFGEANVQFAFHERNRKSINGTDCVVVELSVDYYKDLQAHLLLEVISNTLNGALTDPRMVYVLRWIAGRRAGVPEFDPLYTIQ
jgi:hypothetical protein